MALALTLFAAGVAAYHRKLSAPPPSLSPQLDDLGLPIGVYAAYLTTVVVVFGLVCFAVATLIAWRQPDRPMLQFAALFLVLLAAANQPLTVALTEQHPRWTGLVMLTFGLMGICFIHFLYQGGRALAHAHPSQTNNDAYRQTCGEVRRTRLGFFVEIQVGLQRVRIFQIAAERSRRNANDRQECGIAREGAHPQRLANPARRHGAR